MNTYQGGWNRPRKKSLDYVCIILFFINFKAMSQFQKQQPELFYRKSCSYKFHNIHSKTPVLETSFNRLAGFKTCNFLEKGLQHTCECFPVNIAKLLRTLILMKICKQLFLQFLLLTVNISSWMLVSALNSIGLLQRSS